MTVALDCLVGDWTDWSERSEDGKIRRTRNVMRNAINGGAMCPNLEQTQLGNLYVLVFFNVYLIIIASPVISNLKKENYRLYYLRFYYYHWVDASADGLLVPEGIIRPIVSVSALTWLTLLLKFTVPK